MRYLVELKKKKMSKEEHIKWGDGIIKQISKSNKKTWTEVV